MEQKQSRGKADLSRWLIPAVIGVVITGAATFAVLYVTHDTTEANIRQSLFEQQKERQLDTTKALAQHIGSDMDSILMRLEALSNIEQLQKGDLSSDKVRALARGYFEELNEISYADRLFIMDKDDVATINIVKSPDQPTFEGTDYSSRDYVQKVHATMAPVFSDGYQSLDGKYRMSVIQPIINRETGEYVGLVGASMPSVDFFARYGNIYQIKSQYLAALDRNANHLAHGNHELIGRNFFDDYTQQFTAHNADLNNAMRKVLSGEPAYAVYSIQAGERLTSGHPVFVQGELVYVVFIVTPTSVVYSQIDGILAEERSQLFVQELGLAVAVGLFVAFAVLLNRRLGREVKRRTQELEDSNLRLAEANEQLKASDKLQREFINIAAHELRTPIQPILGAAELIESEFETSAGDKVEVGRPEIDLITRNAKRLERLSSTILEAARIESNSLKLDKKLMNVNESITNIIADARISIDSDARRKDLKILFEPKSSPALVEADEERIQEVVSNLIGNAIKFTETGSIVVASEIKDGYVVVSVKDTGSGIDSELLPKLFTKFATKSERGTGLGLFISKSIIEAHGGTIKAQNNKDGGATFSFMLPAAGDKMRLRHDRRD